MQLDLTPLEKAVGQLEKSLGFLHSELAASDPDLREQFRAATIQAFEYVYELGTKFLRRQLEQIHATPSELRELNFLDLMREAARAGLVQDPLVWRTFRELRNRTSHTYDEAEAEAILDALPVFRESMRAVLTELQRRNHG